MLSNNQFLKFLSLLFLLIFINIPNLSFAWDSSVHEVIAEIAYEQLTPPAKKQLFDLLNQFKILEPKIYTFQQMAAWPDYLRSENYHLFDQWHFINQPFTPDQSPLPPVESQNGVWAVNQIISSFKNTKTDTSDLTVRAFYLAFLAHIVGDLHQPLHASTRVTVNNPQGDEGGNLFLISVDNYPEITNLHQLWDRALFGVPTKFNNKKNIIDFAKTLESQYPESFFGDKANDLNPQDWATESFNIAKNNLYPENNNINDNYINKMQPIALQQIALAGYRLGNLLNQVFN